MVIGGIGLQPSEFGKIIVVLALAKFLAENQPKLERFHFALLPLAIAGGPLPGGFFLYPAAYVAWHVLLQNEQSALIFVEKDGSTRIE